MDNHQQLAEQLEATFFPSARYEGRGVEYAIRIELLLVALYDTARPRTISDLQRNLEKISAGDVGDQLVSEVRGRAKLEPQLLLNDLASRST